jgi:hypothetical protein
MWYIHTMEYYSALEKDGNPEICNNRDELWGLYPKWNIPITEGQI